MEGNARDHFVYHEGRFIGHVWCVNRKDGAHRAGWLYNLPTDELFISTRFRGRTL